MKFPASYFLVGVPVQRGSLPPIPCPDQQAALEILSLMGRELEPTTHLGKPAFKDQLGNFYFGKFCRSFPELHQFLEECGVPKGLSWEQVQELIFRRIQ